MVTVILAVTVFYLDRQLQLPLRKGGDCPHIYRCPAVGSGGRRDVAEAFALWLVDVTVGWVEQVVQAVASERTSAEEVKSRRASYLHLNIWLQKCSWVIDCHKKLTCCGICCHHLVAMEKSSVGTT